MPTKITLEIAHTMALKLIGEGWRIGTGEPNSIVLNMPPGFDLSTEQEFTDYIYLFIEKYDLKIPEITEFHFYKGDKWKGGIILVPDFE